MLPHDWRIEQTPQPDGPLFQAFLPGGVAYYRLRFPIPASECGRRLTVEFDGVLSDATVWCNGFFLGDHLSGYTGFRFDLTDILRYGDEGENVLLVRCDTTAAEGWWYEGGGIYRDVRLISRAPVHLADDGLWITTPEVDDQRALVRLVSTLCNTTEQAVNALVKTILFAPAGAVVGSAEQYVELPALARRDLTEELIVETPERWAPGQGKVYTARVTVLTPEGDLDEHESAFGIRTVEFRDAEGLLVNGEPVALQGANLHQDFAGVGVAVPDRIVAYKLELLTEMGCNAVRSAHHPSSSAFLDAADRLGLLVIAENRLLSSAPDFLQDLEWLIRRDRNHPSIFLWSLENEELLQGTERGKRILTTLVQRARQLDPTRQLSVGGNSHFESDYYRLVDVIGTHYTSQQGSIGRVHALHPDRSYVNDEEGLFPTARGQYEDDSERGLPSAFGTMIGLFGAMRLLKARMTGTEVAEPDPGKPWQWFVDHPRSGGFVWSGLDYFGEPARIAYPSVGSSYGAMDICGYPKDYYWLLRSFFRSEPLVHVLPHWTWPGREGEALKIWVYTNCDEVEILVNGEVVGRRQPQYHIARWDEGVPYQPGELVARGYRAGQVIVETSTQTAGPAYALQIELDRKVIRGDGRDVALAHVTVVDTQGWLAPWAEDTITFTLAGPGTIIGVGNGDPTSLEPHKGEQRRAFRGRCLAIIQGQAEATGPVSVSVRAEGLVGAEATLVLAR